MKWILLFLMVLNLFTATDSTRAQDQLKLPGEVSTWFVNTDGSCVQCSISNCGVWQNCPQASTLLFNSDYGSRQHGGSGPGRVEAYSDKRQIPVYNVTGNNYEDTRPWMIWASRTGRMAAIGCFGSHFQTELYHSDDPNDPKPWKVRNNWRGITDTYYQWTEDEFKKFHMQSGPWVVVLKTPPPPPAGAQYVQWWITH
jgi:hypothetical protein